MTEGLHVFGCSVFEATLGSVSQGSLQPADVADLVQQAYLRFRLSPAFARLCRARDPDGIRAFACVSARNAYRDWLRRKLPRWHTRDPELLDRTTPTSADDPVEAAESLQHVRRTLLRIHPTLLRIVELIATERCSRTEAARRLSLGSRHVVDRLFRKLEGHPELARLRRSFEA